MLEFFMIQPAVKYNGELNKQQSQQLNNIMSNHLYIMETVFKLIWDIEKSWQIDPLSIHPELELRIRSKGHSYPIYDNCSYLFVNNASLDGIKIPLHVYYQNVQKICVPKNFDYNLEDKIIQFFINYHNTIKNRKSAAGY